MTMKRLLVFLVLIMFITAPAVSGGCTSEVINGSGITDSWDMDYTDFARLDINSGFDAEVSRGDIIRVPAYQPAR
jgi:hypothetical protein